jgi:aminopeptidase-like protein
MTTTTQLIADLDRAGTAASILALIEELYPICRSITGNGVRQTLAAVGRELPPLEVVEVPTGTQVLDWTVPKEWNVTDAWVKDPSGRKVIDFQASNLHLVSYSAPVHRHLALAELREHLHSLPDHPDLIPYRTSYYREDWGFCLRDRDLELLPDGTYEVMVDTALTDGSLTYGECFLPGRTTDEVLISTHVCHPSLANDNLSGIAAAVAMGRLLAGLDSRYSYRLLFVPGTIGSLSWLSEHRETASNIKHGLVLTGLGDPGALTYKRSRRGDADMDRVAAHVLGHSGQPHGFVDFTPYGYDERQYCSPGFNLGVGRLGRTPHSEYPEYHTSADDLSFVDPARIVEVIAQVLAMIDVLEHDGRYRNTQPHGEPQLGRRGLYRAVGGNVNQQSVEMGFLWVLNLSDGEHSLLDIAERSGLPFAAIRQAATALYDAELLAALA